MKKSLFAPLFALTIFASFFAGCKKFLDVNKDPNRPVNVQEALILAPAEVNISDNIYGGNAAIIVQYFLQGIAPNQPNPGRWNYQLFSVDFDSDWFAVYVSGLNNLRILNEKAEASGKTNYVAIAKILSAYVLGTATDIWGDVPYSHAFQGSAKFLPAYDKQEDIYKEVQNLLAAAIQDIAKGSAIKPGGDDYFYNGDMEKWKRLAYTLQARYFMHLTKAPGYTAAAQADKALQALNSGMQSNDDDLKFVYEGINTWGQAFDPVSTAVMNTTFVDRLKNGNDPRLSKMVKKAEATGEYTGRTIGTAPAGGLDVYSYPSDFIAGTGAANYIVTYSEALFLKAEATLIKSGAAAAQPIFQEGIRSHMQKLGVSTPEINAYLQSKGTLTAANALQRIMEEKSIANFLNIENYTDWRRTGYPAITKVPGALSEIPRRLLYPESELLNNPQPQQSAKLTDKVWWDQ